MKDTRTPLEKAKAYAEEMNGAGRNWLSVKCDSYGSEHNRRTFWVLEGSPARAIIIEFVEERFCILYDMYGRKVREYR